MSKLRVWWTPQLGVSDCFYIPVTSPIEAKKILDILAAYDAFQLQNNVKTDYCNVGGLQVFEEKEQWWCDWSMETANNYYEDLNEYCNSDDCKMKVELRDFTKSLFNQIDWKTIEKMTK